MLLTRIAGFCLSLLLAASAAAEQPVTIPNFWDPRQRLERPDTSSIRAIRFLTDDDYPPFHFLAPDGSLTGFNVELARLICEELRIACTIQARRWDTLAEALKSQRAGDAIIASLSISAGLGEGVLFTAPYYRTPARFVARKGSTLASPDPKSLAAKLVGVVDRSAHAAFLSDFFPEATVVRFAELGEAQKALAEGKLDAVFGDGVSLAIWLNGEAGAACCGFIGGPYLESHYFGEGVGIALRDDAEGRLLRRAIDYALARIARDGRYSALYLKYFPVGFF